MYRALLRPYLPSRLVGAVSLALTAATVGVLLERLVRGRLLEQIIERAEDANRLISPDVPRPTSPLRSGSPDTTQSWPSLGAPDRKSTRLNSSHVASSYAVFCLKKKKTTSV